jgi:hypothetical protein
MAYTYTYTLAQFTGLTQAQPSIGQLRRDIEAASLGQALLTVMPQQYASVGAETPTAPTSYRVEFANQLIAGSVTTLNGIIAAHTGVYTSPRSKVYSSGGTALEIGSVADGQYLRRVGTGIVGGTPAGGGGVTETSGPTDLTWGAIPDGTLLERNGTELRAAINVARVRQFAATTIASIAATTAGTAETVFTIPVTSGKKYHIEGVVLERASLTTIGYNIVLTASGGMTLSGLIYTAWKTDTGSTSRIQWGTALTTAPNNVNTSSNSTSLDLPLTFSADFSCTGSGNLLVQLYKSGTGNVESKSGTATVYEITWS